MSGRTSTFFGLALIFVSPAAGADTFTDLVRSRDIAGLRALMETDPGAANRGIIDVRREYGGRYRTAQVPPLFYLLSNDLNRGEANTTFRRQALELLLQNGADANEPVKVSYGDGTVTETFRPIHYTLWPQEIRILAAGGADVNQASHLGDTKLIELSRQVISREYDYDDHTNANIRALIRAGARVDLRDRQGDTALDLAIAALYRARRADHPDEREIADNEERVDILRQAQLDQIQRDLDEIRGRTGSGQGAPGNSGGDSSERRDGVPAPSSDSGSDEDVTDDISVTSGR